MRYVRKPRKARKVKGLMFCRKCGKTPVWVAGRNSDWGAWEAVECECGRRTSFCETTEEARVEWNRFLGYEGRK